LFPLQKNITKNGILKFYKAQHKIINLIHLQKLPLFLIYTSVILGDIGILEKEYIQRKYYRRAIENFDKIVT
jgi:hypothetical protein